MKLHKLIVLTSLVGCICFSSCTPKSEPWIKTHPNGDSHITRDSISTAWYHPNQKDKHKNSKANNASDFYITPDVVSENYIDRSSHRP